MESKGKEVKVCPICSSTEVMFAQNPLSKEPKMTPKFAPMGCLGNVCKFYNEETKECIFVLQTVVLSKIATKLLINEIAEAQNRGE